MSVNVLVNGKSRELPDDSTVASVVALLSDSSDGRGVAVALGGEVVPRARWQATEVTDGAQLELVSAVQGG